MEYILPLPAMAALALASPVATTATSVLVFMRLNRHKQEDRRGTIKVSH